MSLHRLALRLAAIEALCPYALMATGPWPTIAQHRVFDSRQEPIEALDPNEARPILIVYTESDESNPFGNAKYPPDEHVVKLTVECLIASRGTMEIANADGTTSILGTLTSPISDGTQEAVLDMLEALVRRALSSTQDHGINGLWLTIATEIHNINSLPLRSANHTVRLLGRSVTFTCKCLPDIWPDRLFNATAAAATPLGLARLPSPLSLVAAAMDPASPAGLICAEIAAAMPNGEAMLPMQGVNIFAQILNSPAVLIQPVTTLSANLAAQSP